MMTRIEDIFYGMVEISCYSYQVSRELVSYIKPPDFQTYGLENFNIVS
jgi:hypothetical protein